VLPDSIQTDFNAVDWNAELSIKSTFRGMTIDSTDEYENASDSIRCNDDGDSNEIDESDLHDEKHDEPTIVTNPGIMTSSEILKQQISLLSTTWIRK
jgi:hypothetical protein